MTPLLILPVLATIDRIEPPMAVVEWPGGALTDVPLARLPADAREGARLMLSPPPRSCPAPAGARR